MGASLRQHLQKALDLYDEKKCRSSIPEFDDVLQFMPKVPDATRLCASAVECLDNEFFVDKISSRVEQSPLFGLSTQMLANSLAGGNNAGFNPLYQIGGPRSIQLALKLQF